MLGKTLLTLAVIALAILVLKRRHDLERKEPAGRAEPTEESHGVSAGDFRLAAYLFLILMFGAGGLIYLNRWQDDRTVLTVNLYRDGESEPVSFQVYKYQLATRSFTTLDGVQITVADNERMEIRGLD